MNTEYIVCMAERGSFAIIAPASTVIVAFAADTVYIRNASTGQMVCEVKYVHGGKFDLALSFYGARNTAIAWATYPTLVPE